MQNHPLPLLLVLLAAACIGPSETKELDTQPELGIAGPETTSSRSAEHHPADLLVTWNQRVLALAEAEDGFLTLKGLRTTMLMHLAVHDALNAITPRYLPFRTLPASPEANPMAAANQAAFEVAVSQYPEERSALQQELVSGLSQIEEGPGKKQGISLGKTASNSVLEAREGDGWDSRAEYQWHPMGPGVYAEFEEHSGTPKGFVFGAGWAIAKPIALSSPSHFRAPPPPAISSAEYAAAFNEVKKVGAAESSLRTADQTHLAMWWKDFAENSHNRLVRQLVSRDQLPLQEAARLFALLNMAIYDAYINVFDNKFHYNHWRPYTAIRWADRDGNPETQVAAQWDNTHNHTYAFPSYPSAHGAACSAAMSVIGSLLGDRRDFSMLTPAVDRAGPFSGKVPMVPTSRTFSSFSSAAEECALSRVYLGIHFRYDSIEGNRLGKAVGDFIVREFLTPDRR